MPAYTTKIGHAHIKVRDVNRSLPFYQTFFDLKVTERVGDQFVFLSGGEMHHELALQGLGIAASTPADYHIGLYHVAFEVPDKAAFATAYNLLKTEGVPFAAVDHQISRAIYFNDPDGNGLEIYVDTRADTNGSPDWQGLTRRLSEDEVLAALETHPAE